MIDPTTMNGLRRPYFDRERSARTPTTGATKMPESGPASQTSDVLDLVSPRARRYGVQSVECASANIFVSDLGGFPPHRARRTRHFNPPSETICTISTSPANHPLLRATYEIPTRQSVKSAIRISSVLPLIDACPDHVAILLELLCLTILLRKDQVSVWIVERHSRY